MKTPVEIRHTAEKSSYGKNRKTKRYCAGSLAVSFCGSGREFVDERISGGFLKDDEIGLGDRHALSPAKKSFDVAVDSFHHSEAYSCGSSSRFRPSDTAA
jgi:hypothetical protein